MDRNEASVRSKWNRQWCDLPEFKSLKSRGDNDDNHGINKMHKGGPKTYGYEGEAEEPINHPGAVSEGDESEGSAEDATYRGTIAGLPPRKENRTRQIHGAREICQMTPHATTRQMTKTAAMDNETVNNLYHKSRDVSSEIISQFIERSRASFLNFWKQILEHRKKHNMEASGSDDNPPYPSDPVLDNTPVPGRPTNFRLATAQGTMDIAHVQSIEDDVKALKRFAESQQAQSPRPTDGPT